MKYFERNKNRFEGVINALFLIGCVAFVGFISWGIVIAEKTEERLMATVAEQAELIAEQDAMITRDNVIISRMLNDTDDESVIVWWDRSLPVYSRWYLLSIGEKVHTFTQHPDPDKFYQLSF
jgi:hypothetical protein